MKTTDCSICNADEVPINDILKIDGSNYCKKCVEEHFSDEKPLENRKVEKELDPTICSSCNTDFGRTELNKVSIYPLCEDCEISLKNKIFPTWVKVFFSGVILIVLCSLLWNWKYYQAYLDFKEAQIMSQNNDMASAVLLMESVIDKVPENEELKTLQAYFKGVNFLLQDKSALAVHEFENCLQKIPAEYQVHILIAQAKMGAAFDRKDYNGFLDAAKLYLAYDTTEAFSFASLASAYSCIYVESAIEEAKENALTYIQRAKQIDTSNKLRLYCEMIEYRLSEKTIITSEEFAKKFPYGWKKR